MTAVSLVPSADRPYVDGSANDSLYSQVFDYNGLGRLTGKWATLAGPPSPLIVSAVESGQLLNAKTMAVKPSWHRLLSGPFAADGGWLLPAALVGALGVLISRRRRWDRRDPLVAAVVLWGGWWLILAVFFSVGTYLNSYYVAALVPAVATLCGVGLAACGPRPWSARVRLIVAATVLGCAGYGAYLMSGTASGPVVLTVVALVAAAAAVAQLVLRPSGRAGHLTALAFAGVSVLLLPVAASVTSVIQGLGPFDSPFESSKTAQNNQLLAAAGPAYTRAAQRLVLETPPGDPFRRRHLRPGGELHSVQRPGGAADRRLPRQRARPDAGQPAGRHRRRFRPALRAAGVTVGIRPASAVDRVALPQAAPAAEQPPSAVGELHLRAGRRPAGRPDAGQPGHWPNAGHRARGPRAGNGDKHQTLDEAPLSAGERCPL
jgi:hypothetical protein